MVACGILVTTSYLPASAGKASAFFADRMTTTKAKKISFKSILIQKKLKKDEKMGLKCYASIVWGLFLNIDCYLATPTQNCLWFFQETVEADLSFRPAALTVQSNFLAVPIHREDVKQRVLMSIQEYDYHVREWIDEWKMKKSSKTNTKTNQMELIWFGFNKTTKKGCYF